MRFTAVGVGRCRRGTGVGGCSVEQGGQGGLQLAEIGQEMEEGSIVGFPLQIANMETVEHVDPFAVLFQFHAGVGQVVPVADTHEQAAVVRRIAVNFVAGQGRCDGLPGAAPRRDHAVGERFQRMDEVARFESRHIRQDLGAQDHFKPGQHGMEQEERHAVVVDLHQALSDAHVGGRWTEPWIEPGQRVLGVERVLVGGAQGEVERYPAPVVGLRQTGAAIQQLDDERVESIQCRQHQRRLVEGVAEVDAMLLGLAQQVAIAMLVVIDAMPLLRRVAGDIRLAGRLDPGLGERPQQVGDGVGGGVVEQQTLRFLVGRTRRQRFARERFGSGGGEHRPRHRLDMEYGSADGLDLVELALPFQPQGLLAPFGLGGSLFGQFGCSAGPQSQQAQERMVAVAFEDVDVRNGACQGYVERIDEELVGVERVVALVAGAAVGEVAFQVGLAHTRSNLAERAGLTGDEPGQDDVIVLEPLGLPHAEDQRRAETAPGLLLVLFAQHDHRETRRPGRLPVQVAPRRLGILQKRHFARAITQRPDQIVAFAVDRAEASLLDAQQAVGNLRDRRGVPVVDVQDAGELGVALAVPLVEEGLDAGPGEEIRMDDLIRVAAEDELAGTAQRLDRQAELNSGQVLDLVDDQKIVRRTAPGVMVMAHEVEIVAPAAGQEVEIPAEQIVDGGAQFGGEDRAAHAQRQVLLAREVGLAGG